jgi:tRNA-dihydrouridine synthase 2
LIFQLGSADPDLAVKAARLVAADVAGIDLNAGCPKPFSTKGGMGAALLRNPSKLCHILEALVKNIATEFDIGISVKIRLLETAEDTEYLVRRLCATGITGLTVHCRTPDMRPANPAIRDQVQMIVGVCHEAGVACLLNGDVDDKDHAKHLVQKFGVDGCMIARAAETNPSCFRTQAEGGRIAWSEMVEEYMRAAMETENRCGNTKYVLGSLVPGRSPKYQPVIQSRSYRELCQALGYENLFEMAETVDARLGLNPKGPHVSRKAKKRMENPYVPGGDKEFWKEWKKQKKQAQDQDQGDRAPAAQEGTGHTALLA